MGLRWRVLGVMQVRCGPPDLRAIVVELMGSRENVARRLANRARMAQASRTMRWRFCVAYVEALSRGRPLFNLAPQPQGV